MKRLITVITLCVMTFWASYTLNARGFGITGGASFIGVKNIDSESITGYHAGLTYKFDLPFGFAIQPSLLYHMKGSAIADAFESGSSVSLKTGYLEVPVSFQWGPDLILFRPFLDVTPFIGYGLNNSITGSYTEHMSDFKSKNSWDGINRLEYGLGIGAGLDLWRLQIIARYNWNFGPLFNNSGRLPSIDDMIDEFKSSVVGNGNFGGVTLTVAIMF